MNLATLLLIICSILTVSAALDEPRSARRRSKCPVQRDLEMDVCASRMGFLGDHSFKVPKNSTAMESFCANLKQSISCLQSYSRECLQGFTKQILTSLLKRGRQQYSYICNTDESRKQFMSRMSCLTDDKIETFHQTMDASVVRFEHISAKVKHDNKLPALCCSYQIFNRDMDSTLNKICGLSTNQDAAQPAANSINAFVHRIVGGTAGEFFSLICDNHRSLDECRRSTKTSDVLDSLEQLSTRVAQGKLTPKSRSLVPVLLEILDESS